MVLPGDHSEYKQVSSRYPEKIELHEVGMKIDLSIDDSLFREAIRHAESAGTPSSS